MNPSPTADGERTVLLLGTLDTKGDEFAFLRERLRDAGVGVLLADVGTLEPASVEADFTREQVGGEAGVDVLVADVGTAGPPHGCDPTSPGSRSRARPAWIWTRSPIAARRSAR